MRGAVVEPLILLAFVTFFSGAKEEGLCRLVDDFYKNNLNESVCHLKCLSDALSRLYGDGQKRLFVNEEVYADAYRIFDDMEGKTGEDVKYLSVIGGVTEGEQDKLEKLISYGNEMGNLVAKVGGLFAEVNESVSAVRKEIPDALIKANKYYTAVAEITRTVWDDVRAVEKGGAGECEDRTFKKARALPTACAKQMCPLRDSMSKDAVQKYKDGCLSVTVQNGSVSECLNKPRDNAYKNVAVKNSGDVLIWKKNGRAATFFQLTVEVENIFGPLIVPFASGQPPSVLLEIMSNITSFYSQFMKVHRNFTSLLLDTNITDNLNSTGSTI